MLNILKDFYEAISIVDLIYLIITITSLIQCYKKGFVLSILSMTKWLLAYIITLIIFPRVKPYFKDIIDNEYVLDVGLGIVIFVVVIFLVLLINKGISKAVSYTGIGSLDTSFGFFFGFVRAYIISVCIYSKTQGLIFLVGKGLMLVSSSFSIKTISPFSTSLTNFAPIISKAQVSDART